MKKFYVASLAILVVLVTVSCPQPVPTITCDSNPCQTPENIENHRTLCKDDKESGYQCLCEEKYYDVDGQCLECTNGPCCNENGELLSVKDPCDDEDPCTEYDACQACQDGVDCFDGLACIGESIQCQQDLNPCLMATGTCDKELANGPCVDLLCCRFDPVWNGEGSPPACPFAGEQDPESWTGECDQQGNCIGCTENAQCNDNNDCTADTCLQEMQKCMYVNLDPGRDCQLESGDTGICVLIGENAYCRKEQGAICTVDSECISRWCVDGFCCDTGCSGTCQACNLEGQQGTCTNIPNNEDPNEECEDLVCHTGLCDGQGSCGYFDINTACGVCKFCDGQGACVLAQENADCGTCQSCNSQGQCVNNSEDHADCSHCQKCHLGNCVNQTSDEDMKEECNPDPGCGSGTCNGSGACNYNTNDCGVCAICDGLGSCDYDETQDDDCGNNENCGWCTSKYTCNHATSETVCRQAPGLCDIAEFCDGQGACPDDTFKDSVTVCRPKAGPCDAAAETCSGTSPDCPDDNFLGIETECRAAAGQCDVPEYCAGVEANCPEDKFKDLGTPCQTSDCTYGDQCNASGECISGPLCTSCDSHCPGTTWYIYDDIKCTDPNCLHCECHSDENRCWRTCTCITNCRS